jgi:hypothetical protein
MEKNMTTTKENLKDEILNGLAHCYGTNGYHKFSILSPLQMTDGVKYLADKAGAFWLLDIIASHQPKAMQDPMLADMQFWTLKVKDGAGVVTCERDTDDVAITQEVDFTDFPLDEIKLYVTNGVILLPSEY